MQKELIVQGRFITEKDILQITEMIASHPQYSLSKLSRELCHIWNWRNQKGVLKDIACRSLLNKLESKGYITLPKRCPSPPPRMRGKANVQLPLPFYSQASSLSQAKPIRIEIVKPGTIKGRLFNALLSTCHYLGYRGSVGEHLPYLIWDGEENVLGCALFGAAAWRLEARDRFIGWSEEQRRANLALIANNMRFLLLKRIPHLASYLLGKITRQISGDFEEKYGHPIVLLETFVEVGRFSGTCYRAANWVYLGETKGRSRNDVHKNLKVPVKKIYVYPLSRDFKETLCA